MNDKRIVINDELQVTGNEYETFNVSSDLFKLTVSDIEKSKELAQKLYGVKDFTIKVFNTSNSTEPIIVFNGEKSPGFELRFADGVNIGMLRVDGAAEYKF
jgi:hypothetical protein